MALNREDKADVKRHLGVKMANKVAKVTRDGGAKDKALSNRTRKDNPYSLKKSGQFGHYEVHHRDKGVILSPTSEKLGKSYIREQMRKNNYG